MKMNNKRLLYMLAAVPVVLLIPMFGSIFTDEVDWDLADFIIMGIMLFMVALGIEFTLRKVKTTKNRIILGACIFVLFALVWGELAVGLFGSPFAGN